MAVRRPRRHRGAVTPLLAGAADALYVVHVGGDYMEARLLLPGFLCCCLAVFVDARQFRTLMAIPLIGLVIWALICVSSLRPDSITLGPQHAR